MADNTSEQKLVTQIHNEPIGITDFSNVGGKVNDKNLNLQDAMNLLAKIAGSNSFIYVGDTPPASNKQYALWLDTAKGDVNKDGILDIRDQVSLHRHISGTEELPDYALNEADVNSDGEIDMDDLHLLADHLLKRL